MLRPTIKRWSRQPFSAEKCELQCMKNRLVLVSIALAISASSLVFADPPPPVTQVATIPTNIPPKAAEVMKLQNSGVEEDVILAFVQNSKTTFDVSAEDIMVLKNEPKLPGSAGAKGAGDTEFSPRKPMLKSKPPNLSNTFRFQRLSAPITSITAVASANVKRSIEKKPRL
jgi:hypothetical protein